MNNKLKLPGGDIFNFQSLQDVKEFCDLQVRRKGFTFNCGVGNNQFPLNLQGGDVSAFVGVVLYDLNGNSTNHLTLTINNSIRIENVSMVFLSRTLNNLAVGGTNNPYTTDEVFPVPYPLSGKDDIAINYYCGIATTLSMEVLYL